MWFRRLQCLVLRAVLSVFIDMRSSECVCSHYGLRACSQTNKLNVLHKSWFLLLSWSPRLRVGLALPWTLVLLLEERLVRSTRYFEFRMFCRCICGVVSTEFPNYGWSWIDDKRIMASLLSDGCRWSQMGINSCFSDGETIQFSACRGIRYPSLELVSGSYFSILCGQLLSVANELCYYTILAWGRKCALLLLHWARFRIYDICQGWLTCLLLGSTRKCTGKSWVTCR